MAQLQVEISVHCHRVADQLQPLQFQPVLHILIFQCQIPGLSLLNVYWNRKSLFHIIT